MRLLTSLFCGVAMLALTACAGGYAPPSGSIYTSVSLNKDVSTATAVGGKSGEACASGILGLISTGDASVKAAASAGGIGTVKAVDYKYSAILGSVMTKVCTVAQGD